VGSRTASHAVHGINTTAVTVRRSASDSACAKRRRRARLRFASLSSARITPEKVLALAAATVGVVGIASALTPELASESDLARGLLPQGVSQLAGAATIAFGIVLLWLSRALARKKRRAWQLAVALVLATAVSHLAKGLDVEEATVSAAVLAALIRYRRCFDVEGDPAALKPLLRVVIAVAALAAVLGARAVDALAFSDRIEDALTILAAGLVARALYLWLRPVAAKLQQTAHTRARAEAIVARSGCDTLSFFALRDDKSYFFSPTGRSFLAYRVVHGVALVSGDPIGDADESDDLVREFRRIAHVHGWRCAFVATSEQLLPLYRSLGLKPIYLGDEAVVRPAHFSLDGRPIRKVRQSVTRLERSGYTASVVSIGAVTTELASELRSVSAEWRGKQPERGFTMAMDALFRYPEALVVLARRDGGEVGGFIQLVPVPGTGGYSLAAMRRRRTAPNGLMEFLLARTIEWARERSVPELSLNFSVFAELLRDPRTPPRSVIRFALLRLDGLFQIDRLLRFNRKFFPEWRPRYICLESRLDSPLVGLAYLRAESLLVPPGPWVRARDLAAR
jgi:lysyl-tRNA synthetase class 2